MTFSTVIRRRAVVGAVGAGAIVGTLLCAGTLCAGTLCAGTAAADPAPRPVNCTAGDIAGVATGVGAALSTYLFTHPDLNSFYTGLQGVPDDQVHADVENYFNAHPQEQADLENIRQPMVDARQRCNWTPLTKQDLPN
jgi:hemophore-related protein